MGSFWIGDYSVLRPSFYRQSSDVVARPLLWRYLIRFLDGMALIGRVVETEGYYHRNDPACHAWRGRTKRNEVMFDPSGHSYVYFAYGNH